MAWGKQKYPRGTPTKGKRSRFESTVFDNALKCGHIVDYEPKHGHLPYVLYYIPDFVLDNGIIVEAKGFFPSEDRTKMLRVKRANPEADIRFVFQRDSKINKGSKTRYTDWAKKHGFIAVVGLSIPEDWFNEEPKD